jgi:hypothetical protein
MSRLSRRGFLWGAAAGAAAIGGSHRLFAQVAEPKAPQPQSRMVDIRNPNWLKDDQVQGEVIKQMVQDGVMALTGKKTVADAWKQFVEPNEKVGIKYNKLTDDFTHASHWINEAIAEGLMAAGVKRENIIVAEGVGVKWQNAEKPDETVGPEIKLSGGTTGLSAFIRTQVDCIINVPDMKEHDRAGITGAMKNLSHARGTIMPNPERFHGPGQQTCDPHIGELCSLGLIRTKRRLNIMNGLKGVFHGGPWAKNPMWQWRHNGLLISTDALCIDKMCLDLVQEQRRIKKTGIGPVDLFDTTRKPIFIATCARMGLGCADLSKVEIIKIGV